jgi:putative transposase
LQSGQKARLKLFFDAPDMVTARKLLADVLADFSEKAPRAMECPENGFDDVISVMVLPEPYRKRLHSTNILERYKPGGAPAESAMRLLGDLLLGQDEIWSMGKSYFNIADRERKEANKEVNKNGKKGFEGKED